MTHICGSILKPRVPYGLPLTNRMTLKLSKFEKTYFFYLKIFEICLSEPKISLPECLVCPNQKFPLRVPLPSLNAFSLRECLFQSKAEFSSLNASSNPKDKQGASRGDPKASYRIVFCTRFTGLLNES